MQTRNNLSTLNPHLRVLLTLVHNLIQTQLTLSDLLLKKLSNPFKGLILFSSINFLINCLKSLTMSLKASQQTFVLIKFTFQSLLISLSNLNPLLKLVLNSYKDILNMTLHQIRINSIPPLNLLNMSTQLQLLSLEQLDLLLKGSPHVWDSNRTLLKMSVQSNNQVQQRGLLTPIVKTLKMNLFGLRIDQLVFDVTQSVKMRSVQFREIMVHYNNQVDFLWNLKGKLEVDLRHVLL